MKRRSRWLKVAFMLFVISAAAEYTLAAIPGPFSFSFALPILNNIFLLPLQLGGCA